MITKPSPVEPVPTGSVAAPAQVAVTTAAADAPPVKALPAAERVYRHIKGALFEQIYPGGTLLNEGELAAAVGVSRTPVREALLRLESEGLVRLYPKKGALVLPMSTKDADDVFEARAMVEQQTARAAFARRVELIPLLNADVEQLKAVARSQDVRAFADADRQFHVRLVDGARNAVLSKFYGSLRERQLCLSLAMLALSPARMRQSIADHTAILDALRANDRRRFLELVGAHTEDAHRTLTGR